MKVRVLAPFQTSYEHGYWPIEAGVELTGAFAGHCFEAGFPVEVIESDEPAVVAEHVVETPTEPELVTETTEQATQASAEPIPAPEVASAAVPAPENAPEASVETPAQVAETPVEGAPVAQDVAAAPAAEVAE